MKKKIINKKNSRIIDFIMPSLCPNTHAKENSCPPECLARHIITSEGHYKKIDFSQWIIHNVHESTLSILLFTACPFECAGNIIKAYKCHANNARYQYQFLRHANNARCQYSYLSRNLICHTILFNPSFLSFLLQPLPNTLRAWSFRRLLCLLLPFVDVASLQV